ncbi:outer membrane protein OmpA-like peptidoglycan-associated protein [Catalinimonas alkaloidigena]|uniref:OmpA family protein n=1 Tax=Catalinimonas alkaloidigena TaxID=1075417 RepID=UPI0024056713|nr:OmpA family protein [Catalinimonas alkaloidigena]MDF9801187.1 outer membrane protein OmpA-like peptidoglycan-associated protein [Catalinimonas alkaloidigena]
MKRLLLTLGFCLHMFLLYSQCPEGLITGEHNLIKNGDFEEDKINFKTDYIQDSVAIAGKYFIVSDAKTFCKCFTGTGDGKFLAVDGSVGANKIVWQQDIEVKANTIYFFSAWASNLYPVYPAVLQFSINGELLGKAFHTSEKQNIWEQFFVNWHSGTNTMATITLVSQNPGSTGNDFGLDRMKFYACERASLQAGLEAIEKGKVIELRNVLFERASAQIISTSYQELDQLVKCLHENPLVEIEIAGHTDNVGKEDDNLKLSQDRANAIGEYLTEKKIEPNRLVMKGYGEQNPIDTNDTLEGHQKNRRVEFKITKL